MLPKIMNDPRNTSDGVCRFSLGHSAGSRRQTMGNRTSAAMIQRDQESAIGGTLMLTDRVTTGGLE